MTRGSDTAKARRMRVRHASTALLTTMAHRSALALLGLATALPPKPALALPQDPHITRGSATITQTAPNELTVTQTSKKLAIQWGSFDIGHGETVIFVQGGLKNQAFNKIAGGQTQILGKLLADGTLILSNAAGIRFGPGAKIDVGRLIATTTNLRLDNFMAGRLQFDEPGAPSGRVMNEGEITIRDGGLVALVAPGVANSGTINARLGRVSLSSGDTFAIDLYGDHLVSFALPQSGPVEATATQGVDQTGHIFAEAGRIELSVSAARRIVDSAINLGGIVQARSIRQVAGEIVLDGGMVNVAGTLDAQGARQSEKGGTVKVIGDQVRLASNAAIDVSGVDGGGTALVGGGFQGKGPERHAKVVVAEAGSRIAADAKVAGDGGTVVLWSDRHTSAAGAISAKGRAAGKGGVVETSSKGALQTTGRVETGEGGTWLLDPRNARVLQNATSGGTFVNGTFVPTSDDAQISAASVNQALDNGTSVRITTGTDGSQAGTIAVEAPIRKTAGGDAALELDAASDILLSADIGSTAGELDLTFRSQGGVVRLASNLSSNAGTIRFEAPVVVSALPTAPRIDSAGLGATAPDGAIVFTRQLASTPNMFANLTLHAGVGVGSATDAGLIQFAGNVGGTDATSQFGELHVESARDVVFNGTANLASYRQDRGTRRTAFFGQVTANPAGNRPAVAITADRLNISGPGIRASGDVLLNLGSTFTFDSGATVQITGGHRFEQSGSATSGTFGGNFGGVLTEGGDIVLKANLTMGGGTTFCSDSFTCADAAQTGDIVLNGTVDAGPGGGIFVVSAGGDATLNGIAGGTAKLADFDIQGDNVTFKSLRATNGGGLHARNAIRGEIQVASLVVDGGRSAVLTGQVGDRPPTSPSDTAHLPQSGNLNGPGPYTLDGVCFAQCQGGNPNPNPGTPSIGVPRRFVAASQSQQETAGTRQYTVQSVSLTDRGSDTVNLPPAEQLAIIAAKVAAKKVKTPYQADTAEAASLRWQMTQSLTQEIYGRPPSKDGQEFNAINLALKSGATPDQIRTVMINLLADNSAKNAEVRRNMIIRSYISAFGRAPSEGEIAYYDGQVQSDPQANDYTGLIERHAGFLRSSKGERDATVRRAYALILGRPANDGEVAFWGDKLAAGKWGDTTFDSFDDLAAYLRNDLKTNADIRRTAVNSVYQEVLGTGPTDAQFRLADYALGPNQGGMLQGAWDSAELLRSAVSKSLKTNSSLRNQVVDRAFQEVFGRQPYPGEEASWAAIVQKSDEPTYALLVERMREDVRTEPNMRNAVVTSNYYDTFGRLPSQPSGGDPGEIGYWGSRLASGESPADFARANVNFLKANKTEAAMTVVRAFVWQTGRYPSQQELNSWTAKVQDPNSGIDGFVDLSLQLSRLPDARGATQIEPRSFDVMTGKGSPNGSTKVVQVAMRGDLTIPGIGTIKAPTKQKTAPSAPAIAKVQGAPQLAGVQPGAALAPPVTSLIGQDGGSLIGQDGGSLIGQDGGSLIGQDGGSLIGQDGGSLIGQDGASLIGQDGGSLIGQDGGSLIGQDGGSLIGQDGGSLIGQDGGSFRH